MTKFEEKYICTYPLQPKLWKRFIDWHFPYLATWNGFTPGIYKPLKYSALYYKIAFLDLIMYIKGSKLYTRLHTKTNDRHMYLNYYSEHSMGLKRSIPYSQISQTQKNTHWTRIFIGGTNIYVFCLHLEGIFPWYCIKGLDENQWGHKGTIIVPNKKTIKTQIHYLRLLQHTVVPITTLMNFSPNIGLFLADLVSLENWGNRTSW